MNYRASLLAILIILVLVSAATFLTKSTQISTGLVIGVPYSCKPTLSLEAPTSLQIEPGGFGEITVKISEVVCGISYVRLELTDFPSEYYVVSPTYIRAISPKDSEEFTIHFDLPIDMDEKVYESEYTLYTNEGRFTQSNLEIIVQKAKKPTTNVTLQKVTKQTIEVEEVSDAQFWWAIAMGSVILSIIVISLDYFTRIEKKTAYKGRSKKKFGEVIETYEKMDKADKESFFNYLKRDKKDKKLKK